jgi:metal-responsive CopG/Arc/MetJ family transcriptional regulator
MSFKKIAISMNEDIFNRVEESRAVNRSAFISHAVNQYFLYEDAKNKAMARDMAQPAL